eukprot:gene4481-4735_t
MQRRRRSSRHSAGAAPELPADVLQTLIGHLSQEDVANASAVCKAWARELRRGITSVKLVLSKANSGHNENGILHPLATHSPNIQELQVLLSGRSSYTLVEGVVSKINMLPKLQRLKLTFLVSPTPKRGPWPLFFSDNMNIGRLGSLVLEGSAMPAIALTPAAGSQLPLFRPPSWLQSSSYTPAGPPGLAVDQLSRLAKLKSLQELALALDPSLPELDAAQFQHLRELHLGLQGPAMPSSVQSWLLPLSSGLPCSLKGLSLSTIPLCSTLLSSITPMTSLTSLQMDMLMPPPDAAGPITSATLDLSSLAQLRQLRRFGLSFRLQQLQLSGLPSAAVLETSWDGLSNLTSLTSLQLQLTLPQVPASPGAAGSNVEVSLTSTLQEETAVQLRLQALPNQLQELQLTNMMVVVPATLPFSAHLTSLSLAHCLIEQQMMNDRRGIGNQGLTHGGLLGLKALRKLRQLRWHVGDALELMPDMTALAQLKGLVALHIPSFLHNQMERWGGYAVLNNMPLCDVHVEMV